MSDQINLDSGFDPVQNAKDEIARSNARLAQTNVLAAQGTDPDTYASYKRLARTLGKPVETVMLDPKAAQHQQAMQGVDFDGLDYVAPTLGKILRNVESAKLIGNDIEQFSKTEAAWLSIKSSVDERLFRPVARGANAAYQQWLDFQNFGASYKYGKNSWQEYRHQREYARETAQVNRNIDAAFAPDSIQQGLQAIQNAKTFGESAIAIWNHPAAVADTTIESFASAVPSLVMAAATGGSSRVATGSAQGLGSYLQEYSSTVKEVMQANGVDINDPKAVEAAYRDEYLMGLAKSKATLRGIAVGVFDGLTAAIAGVAVVGAKNTATSKLTRSLTEFGIQAAGGGAGEATAQAAVGEHSPGSVLMEMAAEVPTAPLDIRNNYNDAGFHIQARDIAKRAVTQAEQAKAAKERFDKLAEMAKADKVLQRAPELIEELVNNTTQDSDASHIYISAQALQQSGLAVDIAAVSPTVAAEIRQATQDNGLIAIPAAEYATRIAPQQWAQTFNDHIQEAPDSLSAFEANRIINENHDALKADFDQAMQSIQADEDFSANADAVKQSIQQELMATGRHREQTAEANATAFAAYFATRAHMLGETPQALYQRTRIKFAPEGGFSFTDGQYTQALAAQPPNGWVHASTGADAAAMWNGQSDAQAVFWTELGGKLQADAPELAGYSHSIGQSAINHIKSRHTDAQTEASRGQLPVTDADIASIPEIVTNYDAIRTDLKGKLGQPMLAFAKRTEDGVLLYLAAGTKKRRNLGAVSMWRYPPSVDVQQVLEHAVAPDPYAQSVMAAWADDSANLENAVEQQTQEAQQFAETEAALGGKPAYEQAKAAGKTKLNYGQWVQVRTPNFKAWFGDWDADPANASKVTDPQTGEPMVVYHGGHRLDGNAFKTDNGFGGIFTNPDYEMAGEYAQQYSEKDGVIYPLFINAKNPVHEDDLTGRAQPELIASAKAAGHDAAWLDATTRRNGKAQYPSLVFFNPTQAKLATPDLYVDGTSFWGHEIVDTGNSGAFDGGNPNILFQSAYHGTPHRGIEQTGFKLNKIGTGEGAQIYGWGIYFAQKKGIAEHYRRVVTEWRNINGTAEEQQTMLDLESAIYSAQEKIEKIQLGIDAGGIWEKHNKDGILIAISQTKEEDYTFRPYSRQKIASLKKQAAQAQATLESSEQTFQNSENLRNLRGQLYSVDIPESHDLLDWDKPLSAQPKQVQKALKTIVKGFSEDTGESIKSVMSWAGADLYNSLAASFTPKSASEALRDAGIPGLRYLDGNSRTNGEGTHNFVIWDESRLTPEAAKIQAYYQAAHSPELNALRELAQMDDLFALPKSHATDVVQAMADIDKSFSFQGKRENIDTDGRTAYDFATKDGETFTIYTRDNEAGAMLPFGHYGYAQSDDYTGRPAFAQRPGENLDGASDGRSDVWVDVSQLKGKGNGAKVYAAAADFAHNTDAVFVGDPNSLSNDGMMRRPIQMLAAAMRWGTTDHIAPHPRQFAGDSSIGVPALQWAKGDTLGNLRKLIDLSLKLEEDSPHGLDITYDPQTNSYRDGNGIPIDRSGIASVAGLSRRESLSDPTRQSGRSNARAAVLRALLREESAGGRGSDGRPVGLLERLSWSVRRDGTLAEQERNLRALFQNDGSAPRGLFDPDSFTIALLSGSDLSTTLHEGAHFFFENDIALAGEIVAEAQAFGYDGLSAGQKQLLADTSTLLSWHGLQGDTAEQLMHWNALEPEAKRAMHERTAESFERYLLEGKAPSLELQSYFGKFRSWMLATYKSLAQMLRQNPQAGQLNADVRGVFDRMLATNEQIELAQQARGMAALFDSPEKGGMSAAEFAAYQADYKQATNEAIAELQAKGIKDMAWRQRTRNKKIKALQKEARQLRNELRHDARRVVMADPVYQAWQFLTSRIGTEDKLPKKPNFSMAAGLDETQDSMLVAIAKLGGINQDETKSMYGVSNKEYAIENPVFGKPVLRKKGGLSIDGMAEQLAELGYLPLNEHGQYDLDDFENRFLDSIAGIDQYSYAYNIDEANAKANFKAGEQVPNPKALGAGRLDKVELLVMPGITPEMVQRLEALRMVAKNGLHPDIVSEIVGGFSSGDELVQALVQAKDPNTVIEAMVDSAMVENYGELSSPEAINTAADQAVFNEARLRFAATEANALAKATGKASVVLQAAKQFAAERIARTKIRDLKPAKYAAASARAAKEAAAAQKRGDTATAAAQKRNEVAQSTAAKAALDAQAEVDKTISHFKRLLQSKTIEAKALLQIDALLGKYDLRTSSSLKAIDRQTRMAAYVRQEITNGNLPELGADLLPDADRARYEAEISTVGEDGEMLYADDAKRIELLAQYLDDAQQTHYRDLTVEQLRGLRDTVDDMAHMGSLKNRLLTAQAGRTLDSIKDEIASGVIDNARRDGQKKPTRNNLPERALKSVKNYFASHIRMAVRALVMDGGKDGGAVWNYFIKPANIATDLETKTNAELAKKLHAILAPALKHRQMGETLWSKGKFYPELGATLNWEARFAILLNLGNASNTQRLLSGGLGTGQPVTQGQVMRIMSEFTTQELQAAQQVWDTFESLRPQIADLELATKGKEPDWIPPRALQIRSKEGELVTLRGGYYPAKYDPEMHAKADQQSESEVIDMKAKAARAAATTRQSFTKSRVPEVHGRPLLLTLDGMYSGLQDVVHDIAWRKYALDMNKLLNSKRIGDAVTEHYGMNAWRDWRKFASDLTIGVQGINAQSERIATMVRRNVGIAGLAMNIMNWLQQPFGMANAAVRFGGGREGWKWLGRGMVKYFQNMKAATKEARDASSFMQERGRTRFRELNEIRNSVNGEDASARVKSFMMSGMIFTQMVADTVVWHAAIERAYAQNPRLEHADAVLMADQAVRDSQGGGQTVDLSEIERNGGEMKKLFTVFMNFMNTGNNLAYLSANTGRGKLSATADMLTVFVIPVLTTALLKGLLVPSGDDGDEGKWLEDLMIDLATFPLAGLFMVRELVPAVQALMGGGYGRSYQGPSGLRPFADAVTFAKQAEQGEADDAFRKAFINLAGSTIGLPSAQINRTWTGAKALADGETDNPAALVFGFQKQ